MKVIQKAVLISSVVAAGVVQAAPASQFQDWGRVLSSSARYERINEPQQICRDERVFVPSESRNNAGAVLGGLAGAIIGSQVGKGNGRVAAAAVGAATGAIAGDRMGGGGASGSVEQTVQRCESVDRWHSRRIGYDVVYEYQGRTYSSFMREAPGNFLRLQVSVRPD